MPDFKRGGIEREINQKIHRMAVRKFKKKKKKDEDKGIVCNKL